MANNEDEVKLTQTTINGIPLPQTPKTEAINESFNLIDDSNVKVIPKKMKTKNNKGAMSSILILGEENGK